MTVGPERVGLFLPSLAGGGAERVFVELANHWSAEGRSVRFICATVAGPLRDEIAPQVEVVDLRKPHVLRALPALRARLAETPDLPVLSCLSHANAVLLLAGRVLGRHRGPIVVQEVARFAARHGGSALRRAVLHRLLPALYRRADRVTAVSGDVADELANLLGWQAGRIEVVPNPVSLKRIRRRAAEPCPHPWLRDGGGPVLLGVGRLSPEKDFASLIEALALLRAEMPARLLLLGEGPEEAALRRLVAARGLDEAVELAGFQPNPWAFMARADLLVVPSLTESFALVIVEALACGTNVVSVDAGAGPRDILRDPAFGPLPPAAEPGALADAIRSRLAAPVAAERLNSAAERFAMADVADRYAALLEPARAAEQRQAGAIARHRSIG